MSVIDFSAEIQKAAEILAKSIHAVAFTGAGLSTRSGIPDFRSPGTGLWTRVYSEGDNVSGAGSIHGFALNSQAFYDGFRPLLKAIFAAQPNPAHIALADLEAYGIIKTLITQNAYLLHQRAGSQNVLEVHGTLAQATCIRCYQSTTGRPILEQFLVDGQVPHCQQCGGVLKPNVILTSEQLPAQTMLAAWKAVRQCEVLLIAGTSLAGGPASELPELALQNGARLIIVNLIPTLLDSYSEVVIHAHVAEILPTLAMAFRQGRKALR